MLIYPTVGIDEEKSLIAQEGYGAWIAQGRIGVQLFSSLFTINGRYVPFLWDFLAVGLWFCSGVVYSYSILAKRENKTDRIELIWFLVYYSALPFVVGEILSFSMFNLQISLGMISAAIAFYLSVLYAEKTEKDSDEGKIKFSQSLFKKTMLEVFTECFKNCVDSIVVNTKELKKMLENTRIKNPHVEIMAALKSFYIGEVIDESGHQHSKRFVGKITIVCSDENEVKAYEHQKSNFGNLEPDPYVILGQQKSKDTMEKEDVKKQITSRKEYVNHEVSQVKSHLSLLEGHSTEYCHWEKQHYHSLIDTQLNECDEPVVGASLHTLETCVDMYQTLLIQYDKLLDEQKKLNGDKK